jgi:anti-sigma factor (TIGR02949 family)
MTEMECPFHLHLSPYLDGELDRLKAVEMKEHLKACAACRKELNLLLEIRNSLKQTANSAKAPASLREKILGEAHQTRKVALILPRSFAYAVPLVAILLVAAIVSFYYLWPWERDSFRDIIGTMVKYHSLYESGEKSPSLRSSSLQDVELWLKRNLDFKILIPRAAFAGYTLVGGDIFEDRGRKFVYLKYQQNGKTIGYVVLEDLALPIDLPEAVDIGGITLHIGKIKETYVGVWKKGGFVYTILTTEDRSELIEYAQGCIRFF